MSDKQRICVIIPALNEEKAIGPVINSVRQHLPNSHIVVMNDGSTDNTKAVASANGAKVLDLPFNLGIGGAVQTGLKYAYRNGYDVAVEIDADGQHGPQYAPQLVKALAEGDSQPAVVIGSRFVKSSDYRSSVLRRFGIHIFSALIKFVTRQRIYDSTSGFRAYSRRAMQMLSHRYPTDFPEPESIVMLLNAGLTIEEVPVEMHERQAGQSVVGSDLSFRALYFVLSNAIAILLTGLKHHLRHARP